MSMVMKSFSLLLALLSMLQGVNGLQGTKPILHNKKGRAGVLVGSDAHTQRSPEPQSSDTASASDDRVSGSVAEVHDRSGHEQKVFNKELEELEEGEGDKASATATEDCTDDPARRRDSRFPTCNHWANIGVDNTKKLFKSNWCQATGKGTKLRPKKNLKKFGEEARETCCHTCSIAPVLMIFGGTKHEYSPWGGLNRPEFVRSEQCSSTECSQCVTSTNCWHGEENLGHNGHSRLPLLKVAVPANSEFTSFAFTAHATCEDANDNSWHIEPKEMTNAEIKLYFDSEYDQTLTATSVDEFTSEKALLIPFTATDKSHFRMVLSPLDPTQEASAEVRLLAKKVDMKVDTCMTTKNCLDIFATDGMTAPEFALRNLNWKQLQCLQSTSDTADVTLTAEESAVCDKWLECMPDDEEETLKTLMLAAGVTPDGTLLELGSAQEPGEDPNQCLNPAISDPEDWECDCFDNMKNACGGVDQACFQGILCNHPKVCQSWKTQNGCPATDSTDADDAGEFIDLGASLMRREKSAEAMQGRKLKDGLDAMEKHTMDNSLTGKCGS